MNVVRWMLSIGIKPERMRNTSIRAIFENCLFKVHAFTNVYDLLQCIHIICSECLCYGYSKNVCQRLITEIDVYHFRLKKKASPYKPNRAPPGIVVCISTHFPHYIIINKGI